MARFKRVLDISCGAAAAVSSIVGAVAAVQKPIEPKCLPTYACIQTLQGHSEGVRALAVCDGFIFAGSYDNGDISIYAFIQTLRGHSNSVIASTVYEGRIFSGR